MYLKSSASKQNKKKIGTRSIEEREIVFSSISTYCRDIITYSIIWCALTVCVVSWIYKEEVKNACNVQLKKILHKWIRMAQQLSCCRMCLFYFKSGNFYKKKPHVLLCTLIRKRFWVVRIWRPFQLTSFTRKQSKLKTH